MLYHLHELQHAALAPFRLMAETIQHVYSHPWVPLSYTRFGRTVAAGCEMLERTTRRYAKPDWNLPHTLIDGEEVAVRPIPVLKRNFCDLVHFERECRREDPVVLLVAPVSGHYATLLRGTVEGLLPDHEVYVTDWIDASEVPLSRGPFDLDDYIQYMRDFLRFLGPNTHVIAVCQPSVPVLAAVSLMAADEDPCQPSSMTLMGGPIDTRVNPTAVNDVAKRHSLYWFERHVVHTVPMLYPGGGRRVYPGFLQLGGFIGMNLERHVDAHIKMFSHLVQGDGDSAEQHREFYDEYMSVMDLPAEYYLQTVKTVFQDHLLPQGLMTSRGRQIDPGLIRSTALMTVEGERDDISGPGQTKAAHDLCTGLAPSMHRHHLQPKVGHYGIFNGRRWREEILPNVRDFIRTHDRPVLAAQEPGRDEPGAVGVAVRRVRPVLPPQA